MAHCGSWNWISWSENRGWSVETSDAAGLRGENLLRLRIGFSVAIQILGTLVVCFPCWQKDSSERNLDLWHNSGVVPKKKGLRNIWATFDPAHKGLNAYHMRKKNCEWNSRLKTSPTETLHSHLEVLCGSTLAARDYSYKFLAWHQ